MNAGDSTGAPGGGTRTRAALTGIVVVAAIGLAGCGSSSSAEPDTAEAASGTYYPVTMRTSHGEVPIETKPERIVALTVPVADQLLSLGVEPVKVAADPANLEETHPWMVEELKGLADPDLVTAGNELDVEAIAAAKPDLILAATYQLRDQALFEQLSTIAPTITPASDALNVDWDKRLLNTAQALGETERAQELISQIKQEYAAVGETVPTISSKTYQWVRVTPHGYAFGNGSVLDLFGLRPAKNQDNTQNSPPLSKERTAELDADLLGVFAPTAERRAGLRDDPLFQSLPAVRNDTVFFADLAMAYAINTPAPIALRWLKGRLAPHITALAG